MKLTCAISIIVGALVPSAVRGQDATIELPAVKIERIEELELVVVGFHGERDWGMGAFISGIVDYQQEMGEPGPLVGIEHSMPGYCGRGPTEFGFVATKRYEVTAPYERRVVPAHEAAVVRIAGRHGLDWVYRHALHRWVESNGYRASGPFTEIYEASPGEHTAYEIRIPIERRGAGGATDGPGDSSADWMDAMLQTGGFAEMAMELVPSWPAADPEDRTWLDEVANRLEILIAIVDRNYEEEKTRTRQFPHPFATNDLSKLLPALVERIDTAANDDGIDRKAVIGRNARTDSRLVAERTAILRELDGIMVRGHMKRLTADEFAKQTADALKRIRGVLTRKPVQVEAPSADKLDEHADEKLSTTDQSE
ncbi:MAG: GyrI-like domain-containing protein [Phycisphaerales bacterium]|nr:GyrI-like domain-containing protein [Phycisphaerales bacterium]